MANGDGVFLLKELRKIHESVPVVIMMSGFSETERDELLKDGASHFVSKPLNFEKLDSIMADLAKSF